MNSLTYTSEGINAFLRFLDVAERQGAKIPAEDLPVIRRVFIEMYEILGGHYDDKD